jgi:hypothetical protein
MSKKIMVLVLAVVSATLFALPRVASAVNQTPNAHNDYSFSLNKDARSLVSRPF